MTSSQRKFELTKTGSSRTALTQLEPKRMEKCKNFTFDPHHSHQFKKILKKFNIVLCFNTQYCVDKQLGKKSKRSRDTEEQAGIYSIPCQTCQKVYIGLMKRSVEARGQEYASHIKNREIIRLVVAAHCREKNHWIVPKTNRSERDL